MKMHVLVAGSLIVFFWNPSMSAEGAPALTNSVTRQIRPSQGGVEIEDTIHLTLKTWDSYPRLQKIFKARQNETTDLTGMVRSFLLDGDDVEIVKYESSIRGEFMDLRIISKVKDFGSKPASLKLLPTQVDRVARASWHLDLYSGKGIRLLWMPELPPPEDLGAVVTGAANESVIMGEAVGWNWDKEALLLRCILNDGESAYTLLESKPWQTPSFLPDVNFLSEVHKSHKMDGNDWRRLFTEFKPAKAGYYMVGTCVFTNPIPAIAQGIKLTPNGMTEEQFVGKSEFLRDLVPLSKPNSLKFTIDGMSSDWKSYNTAWSDARKRSSDDYVFEVAECDYSNDEKHLYLFLKFSPDIEQRFKRLNPDGRLRSLGNIGFFYVRNKTASDKGAKGHRVQPELVGADRMVSVMFGTRVSEGTTKPSVSYLVSSWDSSSEGFDGPPTSSEYSSGNQPLINYGEDGVEMAISMSDLRASKGDKIELIFARGVPNGRFRVVPIILE
jgi:hypothetical protein